MEAGALKLLESATQRTLHAHAFSRSSSQASMVLTDLLSRYMALLTSTCAKYAQHAGRTQLNVRDAMGALDEMGVSLEDLSEYCVTEGRELNRYALYSARRLEDLNDFKSQLMDGLRLDRDDAIPLEYVRVPTPLLESEDESEGEDDEEEVEDDAQMNGHFLDDSEEPFHYYEDAEDVNANMDVELQGSQPTSPRKRRATPPLPLSPISNPSSPSSRKRPRTSNWDPPEHIPDFLPAFPKPTIDESRQGTPLPDGILPGANMLQSGLNLQSIPGTSTAAPLLPADFQQGQSQADKNSAAVAQSTAAAADLLVQVPYDQSSLSSVPEWHLPAPPSSFSSSSSLSRQTRITTEQALLSAYHYILTHPPPPEPPAITPARHKVAMVLIHQAQKNPRWDVADSLFGSVGPCSPRVATIGPSYPVPIEDSVKGKDKDSQLKLPPAMPRPVNAPERIAGFVSQQTSKIPDLGKMILPPQIHTRTTRLSHPPVLHRGTKPLLYGAGIPAPWNMNALPDGPSAPGAPPPTPKDKDGGEKDSSDKAAKPLLPDARLYATWDHETKDFKVPLTSHRPVAHGRSRLGSIQTGSGGITLPGSRSKAMK
ncbi:hypothetical protein CVT24_002227 [Panaeolus cyanescens]|uniref:Bromodomain associated domain-containing protein n=1 Tax=Panaeolus cyanescens TaxID=181874 RepID=A0A409YIL5_9AGAR|nr:hypothetical protein CVT24_002227 [Panaeolus cyanescens]